MTKFQILIFFLLFFPGKFYAQEGVYIGAKVGGGFSRYYFAVDPGIYKPLVIDIVPVYEAGIVFSHQNGKYMGLQIDLQYTQKAWQERFVGDTTEKVLIHYVEMPLLTTARLAFGKKKSALILSFGIYGAYAFASENESNTSSSPYAPLIDYSKSFKNSFDFGFKAGLGYEFLVNQSLLRFQLTFSQGLQDLFERNRVGIYRSLNQSLFASIIYKVPLFKKAKP